MKSAKQKILLAVALLVTYGFLSFGGTSWKEEVLLHDGRKIIVKRSQRYGGLREIGQSAPVKEQDITFTVPETGKTLTWKSEYGEDIGRANFMLLALHILNGTPYIVAEPNLCLSYNKWGRPNPPYVFFRHDGTKWARIPLSEFPAEFQELNLVINSKGEEKTITAHSPVSAEMIKNLNRRLTIRGDQPEHQTILREPVKPKTEGSNVNCEEMIHYKCGWISPHGTFGRDFMDKTCK